MRDLGKAGDALACFRQAADASPSLAALYCKIAADLCRTGREDEALGFVEIAIDKKPDLGFAHFCKGVILASNNQYKEAITCFERNQKRLPNGPHLQ